jgi:hypothetical protein
MNLELTSSFTFYLFLGTTIALIASVVLLWQQIFRKGFLNLVLRFFLLILVQALMVSTVGIGINRSQGFYSSWTDLFGGTQDFTTVAISAESIPRLTALDISKGRNFEKSLTIVKDTISGKDSGVSNVVYLVIPKGASEQIAQGLKLDPNKYQVAEFLTGFPSKPEMWFKALEIEKDITAFNATHDRQLIGVIPEINIDGQNDLECMNLPNGLPLAETWLTSDMKSYADKRLGINSNKWISVGVSTGGWCAFMFALNHTELYSGAMSIAGYYRPALPLKDPLDLQTQMIKKYDIAKFEKALKVKTPIYIVASLGDFYSIRETTRYLAKPHPELTIKYHEILVGGHNPRVWKSSIAPGLNWLTSQIKP